MAGRLLCSAIRYHTLYVRENELISKNEMLHCFANHYFSTNRRPNGFLGLSLNDGTILFLVILLAKTISVA